MRRRLGLMIVAGVLALSGCERNDAPSPAPETARFSHRLSDDISGEYRPVGAGEDSTVASLFVGQETAFAAWEAGQRGASPLILSLAGPQGERRVAVEAYAITDGDVQMTAITPDGGDVRLQARIDQGALATARRNLGDQTPVIVGTVSVDGKRTPFSLGRWGGD